MKKLFLTSIAVLFLATGTAHSADTKVELPDMLSGSWCHKYPWQFPDDYNEVTDTEVMEHLWQSDTNDCANHLSVTFRKDGYDYYRFEPLGSCEFTSIEFVRPGEPADDIRPKDTEIEEEPPSDVYLIRATCKIEDKTVYESYEVQTSNHWLGRRPIVEG